MLNILIVTSQVTYVPGNYQILLKEVFKYFENRQNIRLTGVVSLKSIDRSLLKKILALPLVGVFDLTKNLLKNLFNYQRGERQKLCDQFNILHKNFDDLNQEKAKEWLREEKVDLIINIRTRCLYKNDLLNIPTLGCVNFHHGLLPHYRGTFCDLYALFEGREAGFSLHHMEKKVDSGIIYDVVTVDEGKEKNYEVYLKKAEMLEVLSLTKFLNHLEKEETLPSGTPNQSNKPIYTKNPTPGLIKSMRSQGMIL